MTTTIAPNMQAVADALTAAGLTVTRKLATHHDGGAIEIEIEPVGDFETHEQVWLCWEHTHGWFLALHDAGWDDRDGASHRHELATARDASPSVLALEVCQAADIPAVSRG